MKNLIMTPGPTYIKESVRREMSRELSNPDIDLEFYEVYKNVCKKTQKLLKTENEVLILCGEGILGLEAACASITEENDRVLVIDNGIFGKGFADFVSIYGGKPIMYSCDYENGIDVDKLKAFLEKDSDFKYATVVHCETPSGISNNIKEICPLLKSYGIMTVVDSVSGIGGEAVEVDSWGIDIALGGSQKCLSAPIGLTFLSVSDSAWEAINNRKTEIKSFYCNLAVFKNWYENKWFPYTMPIHLIYAMDKALDNILEKDFVKIHSKIAEAVRYALVEAGLELYPKSAWSNTLTAVKVPSGISFDEIFELMIEKYNIMIGGSFDYLKGKVIRIGHMGENCTMQNVHSTLFALGNVLENLGIKLKANLAEEFMKKVGE